MTLPSQSAGHTPGPWYFGIAYEPERGPQSLDYTGPGYYENPGILGADSTTIVGCDEYDIFGAEGETRRANIALIVSAPDLLAENSKLKGQLEEAVEALEKCVGELVTLRARLSEPYASNVKAASDAARSFLSKLKEAGS